MTQVGIPSKRAMMMSSSFHRHNQMAHNSQLTTHRECLCCVGNIISECIYRFDTQDREREMNGSNERSKKSDASTMSFYLYYWRVVAVVLAFTLITTTTTTTAQQQQQQQQSKPPITLNATAFKALLDDPNSNVNAVVDVRTRSEYIAGHINGSTLVESLASYNTSSQISTPADLMGCEDCRLIIYCRSGSRAAAAIQHLITAGYQGQLYNGLGTSQWTDAGYPLVVDDVSVVPPCTVNTTVSTQCQATTTTTTMSPIATVPTVPTTTTTTMAPAMTPSTTSDGRPTFRRIVNVLKSIATNLILTFLQLITGN